MQARGSRTWHGLGTWASGPRHTHRSSPTGDPEVDIDIWRPRLHPEAYRLRVRLHGDGPAPPGGRRRHRRPVAHRHLGPAAEAGASAGRAAAEPDDVAGGRRPRVVLARVGRDGAVPCRHAATGHRHPGAPPVRSSTRRTTAPAPGPSTPPGRRPGGPRLRDPAPRPAGRRAFRRRRDPAGRQRRLPAGRPDRRAHPRHRRPPPRHPRLHRDGRRRDQRPGRADRAQRASYLRRAGPSSAPGSTAAAAPSTWSTATTSPSRPAAGVPGDQPALIEMVCQPEAPFGAGLGAHCGLHLAVVVDGPDPHLVVAGADVEGGLPLHPRVGDLLRRQGGPLPGAAVELHLDRLDPGVLLPGQAADLHRTRSTPARRRAGRRSARPA